MDEICREQEWMGCIWTGPSNSSCTFGKFTGKGCLCRREPLRNQPGGSKKVNQENSTSQPENPVPTNGTLCRDLVQAFPEGGSPFCHAAKNSYVSGSLTIR